MTCKGFALVVAGAGSTSTSGSDSHASDSSASEALSSSESEGSPSSPPLLVALAWLPPARALPEAAPEEQVIGVWV